MKVRVVPRVFHFKQAAGTSRGVYHERKVWYIVLTDSKNGRQIVGLGECAPLHDLSPDYTQDYEQRLRKICAEFEEKGEIDHEALRPYPSMLFGLETAVLSAQGSLKGNYLQLFDTPFTQGETGIPINGLVWMGTYDEMLSRMEEKLKAGFRCIKIKIGAIDFDSEIELLRKLRARYSRQDVELRVDANGAFPVEEAMRKLEMLARFDIHSIEQPIRAGQWEEMAKLCRNTPLPIALDEELIGIYKKEDKQQLLEHIRPQFIILKPSLHGGLHGAGEWIAEARIRNIPFWITSALESNVGLNAIAQWTSHINPDTGGLHQGLGTGQLFTDNFQGTHLQIEQEQLWIEEKSERDFKAEVRTFRKEWESECPTLEVQTSGSTGAPKTITVEKSRMAASARRTCRFLRLNAGDSALLCMPLKYIAGKMMALRAFVNSMRLIPVAPSAHPFARLHEAPDFAAMTPMQVVETLQKEREKRLLKKVRCLIIGGSAVSEELQAALKDFPNEVWSTYGMTETLSHIALRRLNGKEASESYHPLPGIGISLSDEGCLVVDAPDICPHRLVTNDYATLLPDGSFRISGRRDNTICSGGIKFQAEKIEEKLSGLPAQFAITSVPDPKFGEAITLLYENGANENDLRAFCEKRLSKYEIPKHFIKADQLPLTETGKIARAETKGLAKRLLRETVFGTRGKSPVSDV